MVVWILPPPPPAGFWRSLRETISECFTPASLKCAEIAKESQETVFLVPVPPPAGPLRSLRSLRETMPEDLTPATLKNGSHQSAYPAYMNRPVQRMSVALAPTSSVKAPGSAIQDWAWGS